jgi:ankyrin repeat protein
MYKKTTDSEINCKKFIESLTSGDTLGRLDKMRNAIHTDHRLVSHRFGADNNTALHIAAINNDYNAVRLLFDKDADPNAKNLDGFTPLLYSVLSRSVSRNLRTIELLCEFRASLILQDAEVFKKLIPANVLEVLLQHGAIA